MGHANKDGLSPLRVRISWGGQRYEHTITNAMCSSSWNSEKQFFVGGSKSIASANKQISRINYRLDSMFQYADINNTRPSLEDVKKACGVIVDDAPSNMLLVSDVMKDFIDSESIRAQWKESTKVRVRSILNHIVKYNEKLYINDINQTFINDFVQYLYDLGMRNSTVEKNIHILKWFLGWTNEREITHINIKDINQRFRVIEQEPIYLTEKELNAIAIAELPPVLERVRDTFLFCCFTGLRYSDASNLTKDSIKDGRVSIITEKTDDYLTIDLNSVASGILKKYENYDKIYALPSCSNQKTNEYLKQIGKIANLNSIVVRSYYIKSQRVEERKHKWELITSHCARRTFVAQSLSLGISAEIVMMLTGHSDLKAMKPYMAISEKSKREAVTYLGNILTYKK